MFLGDDESCAKLSSPSWPHVLLSWFILFGILVSYLPQHYRIIARRSSEGLSPYFVLLGTTSGTCQLANILLIPTSRVDMGCCKVNSPFACMAGLLGIMQVGVQWSCFFLLMLLFLIFIPRPSPDFDLYRKQHPGAPGWKEAVTVVCISIAHIIATFVVSIALLARLPSALATWANVLGVISSILACIQYFPQLYVTWRLQQVASLSIPMMCLQTPGAFLWAGSLASTYGAKGWSVWSVFVITGSLQGCLLAMAISFVIRDRRLARENQLSSGNRQNETETDQGDHGSATSGPTEHDETSPLLRSEHQANNHSDP